MQINLNNKTYIMPTIKAKMLRKTLALNEKMDFNNLKVNDLDELVNFVTELFGNQFSIDDIYENVDSKELIPLLTQAIQSVVGETNKTLNQFPKNE